MFRGEAAAGTLRTLCDDYREHANDYERTYCCLLMEREHWRNMGASDSNTEPSWVL